MSGLVRRIAANDNSAIGAEFEKIPELFLRIYQTELLDWARRLGEKGNLLTIRLWNRPGATVVSSDYQPEVTLRCDLLMAPATKHHKMLIQPHTERDAMIVAKHCEVLPNILQEHKDAAAAAKHGRPKQARWVFDGTVPDYFVMRYQAELRAWAYNLKKVGLTKHIVLREGALSDLSPNPEQGAQLIQVALKCRIERMDGDEWQIVVSAADERNEELIAKHCEKLRRANIPPGAVLVEPARPFLPFTPKVDT